MVKWWEEPFLTLDFETTGTDPKEARPLEVYAGFVKADGTVLSSLHGYFNHGQDFEIPEEATAVHGITNEKIKDEGMDARTLLGTLVEYLASYPRYVPVVIFNAPYDYQLLLSEAPRVGVDAIPELHFLDPLLIDRAKNKYVRGPRKLGEMCQRFGVPLVGAHGAAADALASAAVCRRLLSTYAPTVGLQEYQKHQAEWFAAWKKDINAYWAKTGKPQRVTGGWPL